MTQAAFARSVDTASWWRSAVIYQIYPRSFADQNGDGVGDLAGLTSRLPALASLGIDAIWLSPFYPSPQNDGGYDVADYCDVDQLFGTLKDFETMVFRAHELGLKVLIDIVPNHTSEAHPWFDDALASPAGSSARERYIFRSGRGQAGELPPNNWQSSFGGDAWTRLPDGEWYLHLFDSTQPDLNWRNEGVQEEFRRILRFWLERGVDGFRVDVAHGVVKADGLPDYYPDEIVSASELTGERISFAKEGPNPPYMLQEGVHEIWRDWRRVLDSYRPGLVLCAEAWVEPLTRLSDWVRPDEMHTAFNFSFLEAPWDARELRRTIDASLEAFGSVGAPSTWVLSNHDVVRHATRLGLSRPLPYGQGLGSASEEVPSPEIGLRRARAASLLLFALPGSVYLYQGEELGLPEAIELRDSEREDPIWRRSNGLQYGRDGCRVPLPWTADAPAFGFSPTGRSWLEQPAEWGALSRDSQEADPDSTLNLYRRALQLRKEHLLGSGELTWHSRHEDSALRFFNGALTVTVNVSPFAVPCPDGEILLSSDQLDGSLVPPDVCVWSFSR